MTFSIVARDPTSGHMGVATVSQAFAVGSSVSWALPGYGVIATQSMGEPMYGELGLDALRGGLTAPEALTALRSVDPHPHRRQVAMVDAAGQVDVYTGDACVAEAGHRVGDGVAALANMMASPGVWDHMLEAFEVTDGWLPARLLAALRAAHDAGGDLRGARSAALLVVRAERSGRPWRDQVVDVRVDDDPDPVGHLERMVAYSDRYHQMVEAFELALDGSPSLAVAGLPDPAPDAADEPDLALWRAVVLALDGRDAEAAVIGARLRDQAPAFEETARRFADVGLVARDLLERILPAS